jgi:hypothetical protein
LGRSQEHKTDQEKIVPAVENIKYVPIDDLELNTLGECPNDGTVLWDVLSDSEMVAAHRFYFFAASYKHEPSKKIKGDMYVKVQCKFGGLVQEWVDQGLQELPAQPGHAHHCFWSLYDTDNFSDSSNSLFFNEIAVDAFRTASTSGSRTREDGVGGEISKKSSE